MATLAANVLTLVDWAKRVDPDGKAARIAELLSQTNDVLMDMVWQEGNLPTGHRTSVRTGLPTVAWRLLNQGVAKSKSTTAQIDEAVGILEARSEVDKDLADLNGNTAEFRLSEGSAFLESMNQEMAQTLFYGNHGTAPEEFLGFSTRYSSLTATNGENVINAGGTGSDNSSIWLVGWGPQSVFGIFPKGSSAGLIHEDLGLGDAFDASNNRFRAYMDRWQWKSGLALKDWRFAARIANIDISNLVAKSSAADLFDTMIKASHRLPTLNGIRPVYYMNRSCFQMLDIQGRDDVVSGGQLKYEDVAGHRLATFRGIPVHVCDALLENEAVVS